MNILKIGTTVYAVRKSSLEGNKHLAKIAIGKIKTYQNTNGKVFPVIKAVGFQSEIDPTLNHIYTKLEDAIACITPEKVEKTKKNARIKK